MDQHMNLENEKLRTNYFLRLLSIAAIVVEVLCLTLVIGTFPSLFEIVVFVHSISLIWSVLYHLVPCLRTNFIFRFFAQTASTLILMLFIYTVYGFIIASEQYDPLIWLSSLLASLHSILYRSSSSSFSDSSVTP